jgi:hypothetical protein
MSVSINGTNGLVFNDGSTQNTSPFTGGFGFRNRIINGDMRIPQRGTSFSVGSAAYTLDRWQVYGSGANVSVAQVAGPTSFKNAIQITGAASVTQAGIFQRIESTNVSDLSGQTVTIQANIAVSTSQTVLWQLLTANATDNFSSTTTIASGTWSVTTTATTYTATVTGLPASVLNGLQIAIYPNNAGAFTSGTITITGAQLEKGSTATSFDYRPYGTEEMLCKRYFQVRDSSVGIASNASVFGGTLPFGVDMRANPTLGLTAALQVTDTWSADFTQSPASIAIQSGRVTKAAVNFTCPNFSGMTQGRAMIMNPVSGGSITLSAEL